MIENFIQMNGYGIYVWPAFLFTLTSFMFLYITIKYHLVKEKEKFKIKYENLNLEKIKVANRQSIYKKIYINSSASNI